MKPATVEMFQFETERFTVRPLTPDDLTESYLAWWNDPGVQTGLNSLPRAWNMQQARAHMNTFDNKNRFQIGLFSKASGDLVGFCGVFLPPGHGVARCNLVIGEEKFRGVRVADEFGTVMLSILFDRLQVDKVKAEIHGDNPASVALCRSLGFTQEGVLREELPGFSGGRVDVVVFGYLRDEWLAKREG